MEIPLIITSIQIDLTEAEARLIREQAARLDRVYQPIVRCQAYVEGPGRHHRNGGTNAVRLVLRVPGGEITVDRAASPELPVAIRDAFAAARRQLEEHARRERGEVKAHAGARAEEYTGRAGEP